MPELNLLDISEYCQASTIFLSLIAYVPQWKTIYEKKTSKNISLSSWTLWIFSTALALFYAAVQYQAHGTGMVLAVTSLLSFLFVLVTVGLIVYYREKADYDQEALQRLRDINDGMREAAQSLHDLGEIDESDSLEPHLSISPMHI